MAVTPLTPNTILLAGMPRLINDYAAGASITPGMFIELYNDSGTMKWRPHSAAANVQPKFVALNQDLMNLGVDSAYSAGDLVIAHSLDVGDIVWALFPSGQDITQGDGVQSNGDGYAKEATAATASANVSHFQALETIGAITELTRCRIQVVA